MSTLQPLFSWAGGKKTTINELLKYVPPEYNDYYEPFVGSGRMLFSLKYSNNIYINDINKALINTYKIIQNEPKKLIEELAHFKSKNTEEDYYKIRKNFNNQKKDLDSNNIELAAIFIYLMRTAYGGIYRVNKRGDFNTSYWKRSYYNNYLPSNEKILEVSKFLNTVSMICCEDFTKILEQCKEDDFIYIDPPYINSTFRYDEIEFSYDDHVRLKSVADKLDEKKCKWMISNIYDSRILDLYRDYKIIDIASSLRIDSKLNSKEKNKENYREIIIVNY